LPPKKKSQLKYSTTTATSTKVDVVKFVKPVVAKAEEVTEEPPKIVELKKEDWCRNN
jgi:protein TonB